MATVAKFDDQEASRAMVDGLLSRIRQELKARIMERIEPDVEAALDASLEVFKVAIKRRFDAADMSDVIQVIIERRDK